MPHDTEFELFRDSYRRFLKEQVAPYYEQWEHDGLIPRDLWLRLGENGFLCVDVPKEYGGYGAPVHYSLMLVHETAQAFVDQCAALYQQHLLSVTQVAALKCFITDIQCEVIDQLLQLFGGYGYMQEYPISRFFVDARVQKIYGGTNEIMKEIVARELLGK